jgi:hypothetical protein
VIAVLVVGMGLIAIRSRLVDRTCAVPSPAVNVKEVRAGGQVRLLRGGASCDRGLPGPYQGKVVLVRPGDPAGQRTLTHARIEPDGSASVLVTIPPGTPAGPAFLGLQAVEDTCPDPGSCVPYTAALTVTGD